MRFRVPALDQSDSICSIYYNYDLNLKKSRKQSRGICFSSCTTVASYNIDAVASGIELAYCITGNLVSIKLGAMAVI